MLLIVTFQSCQDSRLYPEGEAAQAQIRETASAMLVVGNSIRSYIREVEREPESIEALETRGYLELQPEFRAQWDLQLDKNSRGHTIIRARSTPAALVGKDLELKYDFTAEKWLRPYKIR